jgi:hypothetical protein
LLINHSGLPDFQTIKNLRYRRLFTKGNSKYYWLVSRDLIYF